MRLETLLTQIKNLQPIQLNFNKATQNISQTSLIVLRYNCNHSITEVTFPSRLKYSKVKPVFKKADNCCFTNYRQVWPLTDFSKITNKSVYEFFNSKSTLQEEKFEFRKDLSTKTYTASQMKSCTPKNKMSLSFL